MILMIFNLGKDQQLVIPARNFLALVDDSETKGSKISYNLDDADKIVYVNSTLSAKETLMHVYEAVE